MITYISIDESNGKRKYFSKNIQCHYIYKYIYIASLENYVNTLP